MSYIGSIYHTIYTKICGQPPNINCFHFQFLVYQDIYKDLKRILPDINGKVLDVGCGEKPYEFLLESTDTYIGIDIDPGSKVDFVIETQKSWPFEAAVFDAAISTQVLEHAEDLGDLLSEIHRVLKPAGELLITVPFIYNEHGSPHDYRRFSIHGIRNLLGEKYEIIELKPQGGIGSTSCTLLLNWIEMQSNRHILTRLVKGLIFPVWLLFCCFINSLGWFLNRLDTTEVFYNNVLCRARKRCD